ncbi:hypothetical protein [Marinomonas sp. THO17]|uniref:hypothetical protein n=1 Tax=Marinomonas sp. THO17 TaxID=3149048 RepID=UPI00336C1FBD
MIIIAILQHVSVCFQRYYSRKKLASLPQELRKDMGIMQDSFDVEVGKGRIGYLLKELVHPLWLQVTKKPPNSR